MKDSDICMFIKQALELVLKNDRWLLANNNSEQSISHKIAFYLQPLFANYNVDCEYNGDVTRKNNKKAIGVLKNELKNIGLLRDSEASNLEKELTKRAVFPDIIIHERGNNDNNLCIIEVKKSSSRVSYQYDYLKLQAYTSKNYENNLKYQIGIFVEAVCKPNHQKFIFKYFKEGKEIIDFPDRIIFTEI